MKINVLALLGPVLVLAVAGCLSVESTRENLASGSPESQQKAREEIKMIVQTGHSGNRLQSFEIQERIDFAMLIDDPNEVLEIVKDSDNIRVKIGVLESVDIAKPGVAFAAIKYFNPNEIAEFEQVRTVNGWQSVRISEEIRNDVRKRTEAVLAKAVDALSEDELALIAFDNRYESPFKDIDADTRGQIVVRLVQTAQNPKTLCRIILGDLGPVLESAGNRNATGNENSLRADVVKRLMPNIDMLSPSTVKKMLTTFDQSRGDLKLASHPEYRQIAFKLIARLPADELTHEEFAMTAERSIGVWYPSFDDAKRNGVIAWEYAIAAAKLSQNRELAVKLADKIVDDLLQMKQGCDGSFSVEWDKRDNECAKLFVKRCIGLAGADWFVGKLASVETAPRFLCDNITPAIAVAALAKGNIKSAKIESELVGVVPAEKITIAMLDNVKSGSAKKALTGKVPESLKAQQSEQQAEAVARILEDAKAQEPKTFVLGGFYLGMQVEDALILLRHYTDGERNCDLAMDGKIPLIKLQGQGDVFARAYADTKRVHTFNFGPWILRKFCDYDAQNDVEWAAAFNDDKGLKMSPKSITKSRDYVAFVQLETIQEPTMLTQGTWQHKNPKKQFRLTYFGEREIEDGGLPFTQDALALELYDDISAKEGTLRLEFLRD